MTEERQRGFERKKKRYRTVYKRDVPYRDTPFRKKPGDKKKR